jgi:hypothetical protein
MAETHDTSEETTLSMLTSFKSAIKKLPIFHKRISELDKLHLELVALKKNQGFVPPGHFYSPIPSLAEIRRDESQIFGSVPRDIPGLELYE